MKEELEKKFLGKLKEGLEKESADAFENGNIAQNLKDEFREEKSNASIDEGKDLSDEEFENELEKESIDSDFEKTPEDLLEEHNVANPNLSIEKKIIESAKANEAAQSQPASGAQNNQPEIKESAETKQELPKQESLKQGQPIQASSEAIANEKPPIETEKKAAETSIDSQSVNQAIGQNTQAPIQEQAQQPAIQPKSPLMEKKKSKLPLILFLGAMVLLMIAAVWLFLF